jgi:hypothetical protein
VLLVVEDASKGQRPDPGRRIRGSGIERIGPLVDGLQILCGGRELGDPKVAASSMLAYLESGRPDVPKVSLESDPEEDLDVEGLALRIVCDVGEMAGLLLAAGSLEKLAWSRANLISDLERYRAAIGADA